MSNSEVIGTAVAYALTGMLSALIIVSVAFALIDKGIEKIRKWRNESKHKNKHKDEPSS